MPPTKPEPGRDTEMPGRTATLNVVFALTSIGLLFALTYMIWDDYNRDWKHYQKRFNQLEVKLTQDQVQQALVKVDAARRQQVQAQLAQGEKEIDARRGEVKRAEKDAAKLDADWYRVDQEYRFTKAEIDVVFNGTHKVDLCIHNHLGIDKRGFENAPQPLTTQPNFQFYLQGPQPVEMDGCTSCQQVRGRVTSFVNAVHTASSVEQQKQ